MEKRNDRQREILIFFFLWEKKNQIEKQGFSGGYQNMQVILIK